MKTIRIKTLFFSLLSSAAISSIIFSSEKIHLEKDSLQKNLRDAIKHGDMTNIRQALALKVNINETDGENDFTPLMFALINQNLEPARLLRKNNAKFFALTVLNLAQHSRTVEPPDKIQLCKQENEKLRQEQIRQVKDLFYVAASGEQEMLKLLLSKEGAGIDQEDYYNRTALVHATTRGHTQAVRSLIKNCANIDHQCYPMGPTPLTIAAFNGHPTIVALLLANSADPDETIKYGRTALMFAAGHGHPITVEILLANNAVTGKHDDNGYTASRFATENGHPEIVTLLTDEENWH